MADVLSALVLPHNLKCHYLDCLIVLATLPWFPRQSRGLLWLPGRNVDMQGMARIPMPCAGLTRMVWGQVFGTVYGEHNCTHNWIPHSSLASSFQGCGGAGVEVNWWQAALMLGDQQPFSLLAFRGICASGTNALAGTALPKNAKMNQKWTYRKQEEMKIYKCACRITRESLLWGFCTVVNNGWKTCG